MSLSNDFCTRTLFIAMFIATIGELMYVPIKQAMIVELAPSNARRTYMAFNSLTFYGAMILSSLESGFAQYIWGDCFLLWD